MHTLLERASTILNPLAQAGFPAYVVGGAVRDTLLGRVVHDMDITTAATPQETQSVFPHLRCIETGLEHGTITLIVDGSPVEVTTFRLEGDYSDHRRPDGVSFTRNLEDDLSRRDFTINAMALGAEGIVDLFGGLDDLSARYIRCVGDPNRRFQEDALRILRALRFASCLDFRIHPDTAAAIHRHASLLCHVSQERITAELMRLLEGVSAMEIMLAYPDVMQIIIPELAPSMGLKQHTPYHCYDVYTHSVRAMNLMPPDATLRLAALLHDVGKPATRSLDEDGFGHFNNHPQIGGEMAENITRRMKLPTATCRTIAQLIQLHGTFLHGSAADIPRLLSKLGPTLFFQLLALDRGDNLAKRPGLTPSMDYWDNLRDTAVQFLKSDPCLTLAQLAIDGRDALEHGFQGREIGVVLHTILDEVVSGQAENNRTQLLMRLDELRSDP